MNKKTQKYLLFTFLALLAALRINAQCPTSISEIQKIVASDRAGADNFGGAVAVSGNYAIIGASNEDHDASGMNTRNEAGSAYIYERNSSGVWTEVQKIVASDRTFSDRFGGSVSISGNYLVVGAHFEDQDASGVNTLSSAGSAYVFERNSSGVWIEVQKIVASDRGSYDFFGFSVSISGNYLVVGAFEEDQDVLGASTRSNAGSAYVFERNSSGAWIEVQKIVASDRASDDSFGASVSISGSYLVVGAINEDHDVLGGNNWISAGSIYVFERNLGGVWVEAQKLVASDRRSSDQLGISVSISGNYLVAGAYFEDEDASGMNTLSYSGSAYVFERNSSGVWAEVQKIVASDRGASDRFGASVSISGSYLIVSSYNEDEDTAGMNRLSNAGSSYIFGRNSSGGWVEIQKIVASDRAVSDRFGYSVAISGNYLVVGADLEDQNASGSSTLSSAGSAYIFELSTLASSDTTFNITICDSLVSATGKVFRTSGTFYDTLTAANGCDSILIYNLSINYSSIAEIQKIVASDRGAGNNFGNAVSISGNYAIVGALEEEEDVNGLNTITNAGASYVYEKNASGVWVEVQKLVASDRGTNDYFGYSVSISGNYAIVGANNESHDVSGANFRVRAGASYIFERNSSGVWVEVQKIVASDRNSNDYFGESVSISGNYAIIGARTEDEDANGNNTLAASGSSYIFERNTSGAWAEVQKIVASDRGLADNFGISVSISGNQAIIGARLEDEDGSGGNTLSGAGSAYLFERNASGIWVETQKISASDRGMDDYFGASVSISGNHAIIGAYGEDEDASGLNTSVFSGSSYIFEKNTSGVWVEAQKIVASDRNSNDYFGWSVSISGNYAIVGARFETHDANGLNNLAAAGSSYIFEKNTSGTWVEFQKIVPSDRAFNDVFGNSVSISGNQVIVGAINEDDDTSGLNPLANAGSAYVFEFEVTPSLDSVKDTVCGSYTTLTGRTFTATGIYYDTLANASGCDSIVKYDIVIRNSPDTAFNITICDSLVSATGKVWRVPGTFYDTLTASNGCDSILIYNLSINYSSISEIQKIVASDRGAGDRFGGSVSISGNYAVIGASREEEDTAGINSLSRAGSVYLFEKNSSGVWQEKQKLVASDRAANDLFGYSVSISGNYAVVGAISEDEDTAGMNTMNSAGSAYVFERNTSGVWQEKQKLVASDRGAADGFGFSVSISGNYAMIGAISEDEDTAGMNTLSASGSAYVFEKNSSGVWQEKQKLVASDRGADDFFGLSVSISGSYAVIGAIWEDEDTAGMNTLSASGSAYVFEKNSSGVWQEKQKLVASDRGADDFFGYSVSISGNYAVIGAAREDEDTAGINTMNSAGSAYVFERSSSGVWQEKQKLVASDRGANDQLGYSVSISGNYAMIGAFLEGEDTAGMNTLSSSGSAYVFERNSSGVWQEKQKLVASDRGVDDQFGYSVSLSGSYAVIGAHFEDEDTAGMNTLTTAGSAYIFEFAVTPSLDSVRDTVCGSYITLTGKVFDSTGIYYDTLANSAGCDSVVKYDLLVNYAADTIITDTVCDSLISPSGKIWTSSGIYLDTIINISGCDSLMTFNLTVNQTTDTSFSVSVCDSLISPSGKIWRTTGIYLDTITNAVGCDSLMTINLTISTVYLDTTVEVRCDSAFAWRGTSYASSTLISDTVTTGTCDSIFTLDLTINLSSIQTINDTACDSLQLPNGNFVTSSGTYPDTLTRANNCDSIVVHVIIINNSTVSSQSLTVCDSLISPSGKIWRTTGIYLDTINNAIGCDSLMTINLTISTVYLDTTVEVRCDSAFTWRGTSYASSTLISDTVTTGTCDSIFTLDLTINLSSIQTINDTACDSLQLPNGNFVTSSGTYPDTLTRANNCDSIVVHVIIINNSTVSSQSLTVCDSLISPSGKIWRTTGIYLDTINNAIGCDSLMTINLTISTVYLDTTVEVRCDSAFTWRGTSYASSTLISDTITTGTCDSIFTLDLTINLSSIQTVNDTACDSLQLPNGNFVTSSGTYPDTLTRANNCDSIVVHEIIINNSTVSSQTLTICDSLISPSGKIWRTTGIYLDTINNAIGCDSLMTINLTISTVYLDTTVEVRCDSAFTWRGTSYAISTLISDTITTGTCDSIFTLDLTINLSSIQTVNDTACDSLQLPNGNFVTSSGTYPDTLVATNNCDSIVVHEIIINNSTISSQTLTVCDSLISPSGKIWRTTGIYLDTINNAIGCDSLMTINLTISTVYLDTTVEVRCDSAFAWRGTSYASSTLISDTITTGTCDSIFTLDLTINLSSIQTVNDTACDSLQLPNGNFVTSSGTYPDTLTRVNNCDSIVVHEIIINNSTISSQTLTVCDSLISPSGKIWRTTGIYLDTINNAVGCDSLMTINLTISTVYLDTTVEVRCDSAFAWRGTSYASSTLISDTITTGTCDSIFTLDLTINLSSIQTVNDTACDSLQLPNGNFVTTSGSYPDTLTRVNNCDSIVVHEIIINNSTISSQTLTVCDSLFSPSGKTWRTTGIYLDTINNAIGCDSLMTFNLTISTVYLDTTVEVRCDSAFTWRGTSYAISTLISDTITTGTCDSIFTLDLTINLSSIQTVNDTACDSLQLPNGNFVTSSGTYPDTLTRVNNCDSIVVHEIIINNSTVSSQSLTICDSLVSPSGKIWRTTGIYLDTINNAIGCDSLMTINLTVNNNTSSTQAISVCDSLLSPSGKNWTTTGAYLDTIMNASGCDSLMTINLTVNYTIITSATLSGCDSVVLPGGNTVFTSGTYQDTLVRAFSCDSIIMTNVTLEFSLSQNQNITLCEGQTTTVGSSIYDSTGIYRDTLQTSIGCDSIIVTNLLVNPLIPARIDTNFSNLCEGAPPIQLFAIPAGGTWSGTGINATGTFDPAGLVAGMFQIIYTPSGICGTSDTVEIEVYSKPILTFVALDDTCTESVGSITTSINNGTLPYNFLWNTGSVTQNLTGLQEGVYRLIVVDFNTCSDTLSANLDNYETDECDYQVWLPNIFSPDGNGENDVVYVEGTGIENLNFKVFNRWGNLVFESTDKSSGWDGTYKGSPANVGVFVYYIKGTFLNGEEFDEKGTITLVR